ncbi:GNAT family N-acetyltransferase [Streptomyces sp. WMMC897]|uniref:GNAT family N-acetyltransferase n=1 Tax=Streptomyces sp. WMMC897 TaxID=3014782 RepID=UPI0022B691C8|nr:GNAT family N-acetyltransferase [Streptomyces sp. WMMC897]MCZ7415226.1 GNAT family N-acetyltransferase [Streptomyces sp. WMMC897]
MTPRVRSLGPEGWPVWRELRLRALAEAPYAFGSTLAEWTGDGDREARWRARLAIPGSRSFIASLGGQDVGMAGGIPGRTAGVTELTSFWVAPEARGRAVGDALIRAVEDFARASGSALLELAVRPDNAPALALYRRNGLTDTGPQGDLTPDGRREHILRKPLTRG